MTDDEKYRALIEKDPAYDGAFFAAVKTTGIVLLLIGVSNTYGYQNTLYEVADLTGLDKMAVSRALTGLKRHKRVQRHDDPTDQRSSRLYLTRIGRDLFSLVNAQAHAREAELFGGVSADELAQLGATLDKLVAAVANTRP